MQIIKRVMSALGAAGGAFLLYGFLFEENDADSRILGIGVSILFMAAAIHLFLFPEKWSGNRDVDGGANGG